MPSWWVHRFFAHELGLDVELSRIVDEIIDFAHILPDEYETPYGVFRFPERVEKRHDWVKDYPVEAVIQFYHDFGIEAVKAMILHACLDHIYLNMRWCTDKNIKFDVYISLEKLNNSKFLKELRNITSTKVVTDQIYHFIFNNAERIKELIEVDINPSRIIGRCEVCGNVSNDVIRCDHCGTLFPGWLWIIFLEEIRELKDRIANPTYGIVTSIDRDNEMLTIRLFSEPKDFDEGTIVGCVVGNRVEKIGKIIHFDKIDNEITVDFSELKIPEWLDENKKVKLANAENLIGYQLQEAWILEAQRNFKGLYNIITEILKSSLSDESKQELKESLERVIRNAESAIRIFRQKEKERVNPVDFKDKTSLSGKFKLDESQINVVRHILGLKDNQILIIVGPPGTGKTEVIAKSAYELVKRGEKVLITSHTNIAVDNALEKLADKEDIEIVRVGRPEKISDKLKKVMLSKVRYERAPKDLVDKIKELEQEIRILREKLRELKDLREELRETEKSKIHEIAQKIEKVISGESKEILKYLMEIIKIDIELNEIKKRIDDIGKILPPYLRNRLRGLAWYYGGNITLVGSSPIEVEYFKLWCEYFKLKYNKEEIYLKYLKDRGFKVTKKTIEGMIKDEIKEKTKELIGKKKELKRLIELAERSTLKRANVVGSTIIRSHLGTLFNITFDTVIIDECSQISIPLGLMGLIKGRKWVIIGDHLQLLPIFRNIRSDNINLHKKISIFSYLIEKFGKDAYLGVHYRSLPDIIEFSKESIYKEAGINIEISKDSGKTCEKLEKLLSLVSFLKYPVVFMDVAGTCKAGEGRSIYNEEEIKVIQEIVNTLKDLGLEGERIGIITPYVAQAKKLREVIKDSNIEINTVDSFQGREKDIIIFSVTGTDKNRINFASNQNRLNVALTRAKCRLIVVGNVNAIKRTGTKLEEFLELITSKGYLFDWDNKKWIHEGLVL